MNIYDLEKTRIELARFVRFLLAGGAAAVVNISCRILFNRFMPYEVAIPAAYAIGMLCAFVLNRLLVFAPSGRGVGVDGIRFVLVNLLGVAQVWCVSVALARIVFPAVGFTDHAYTVAHVIGVMSPVITSYLGHKYFSFRPKNVSAP